MIRDKAGVLETSIDDSLPYEPNVTMEESDEEEEKPCLDEQIKKLEEEIIQPSVQKELNLSPQLVQTAATSQVKKESGKSNAVVPLKSVILSVTVVLSLSVIIFYVVFFSPVNQHPFVSSVREHLRFLEPVRDFVAQKTKQVVSYFKK